MYQLPVSLVCDCVLLDDSEHTRHCQRQCILEGVSRGCIPTFELLSAMAQARSRLQQVASLLLLIIASTNVYAVRLPEQKLIAGAQPPVPGVSVGCDGDLNTYFVSAENVQIETASSIGRKGTTRLTVQLKQDQVSSMMPVVTATPTGLLHNVAYTWSFLKVRDG